MFHVAVTGMVRGGLASDKFRLFDDYKDVVQFLRDEETSYGPGYVAVGDAKAATGLLSDESVFMTLTNKTGSHVIGYHVTRVRVGF